MHLTSMEPANVSGFTAWQRPKGEKAAQEDQLTPHPHFREGGNFKFGPEASHDTAQNEARPQGVFVEAAPNLGNYNPWEIHGKKKQKKVRFTDDELGKAERELERAAQRSELQAQIEPGLIATMAFEDGDTQATQPYTDPRRLGLHSSGITEHDAANVICILHPSSPAAHEAVAATIELNPNHIIPNTDLVTEEDESLFDPAPRLEHTTREIALRMSSQVKSLDNGFTFGRNPDKCDILLTRDRSGVNNNLSNRHFRIYLTKAGVLMLQDTSTNGTLVDNSHLARKQRRGTDEASRMLQNGSIISIIGSDKKEIKFLVRVPNRGDHQDTYNANLARYVNTLPGPKSKLVLGAAENTFGMHWNGGSVYNVIGLLGKGAFATVFRLATKNDGQVYAAKELDKRRFLKNGILDMKFDNEIQIMKGLRHPNIVQYEDYHDHHDWAYIIMEIVTGGELSNHMHKNGPLSEPMVQNMTRQILHALAYLHARGITHRDIKPDNILIAELDPLHVKLSDFGLSKCITNQETFLKTFCGTLLYCAPEIYPGYGDYDKTGNRKRHRLGDSPPKTYSERVDMWSFGAVLFHVLCNKPPVMSEGEDKAAKMLTSIMTKDIDFSPLYAADVSEEAVDFVSNLLKRNPMLRPTPKACFEHAWIAEVADLVDYMNLDDEMPAYRGQGLATVAEVDEELLTKSQDAAYDQLVGAEGALSFGYLNTAGERVSKRLRITPRAKVTAQPTDAVVYPELPQVSNPIGAPATDARGERLFGEITSSALQSSGVFAATPPSTAVPALQHGIEQISVNDFVTFESSEPPPSTGESSGQPFRYPRALGMPGALQPSSAPSLLGAEAQINQLNMASPEAGHSEATTPDTGNPMTPETAELTPAPTQQQNAGEVRSSKEPATEAPEAPVFSRYIPLQVPESLQHDIEFVNEFNAREAENRARRARQAEERQARKAEEQRAGTTKAKTFSGFQDPKPGKGGLAKTLDARAGEEVDSGCTSNQKAEQKFSRRIDLPPLESLYPTSTTTPDGFTKPLRRFGKLTTVPGSYIDLTIYINSRMTSWGRGPSCNIQYEDQTDLRIPLYPIQITYHAPEMDARIAKGQPWETSPGIHTVIHTAEGIKVNDVELQHESSEERCAYYGKIYTGDIITVYQSPEPNGPFLKFRVEMNYGDSARKRPESEKGFQVRKETRFYEQEMKRREGMKSDSGEATASGSALKVT